MEHRAAGEITQLAETRLEEMMGGGGAAERVGEHSPRSHETAAHSRSPHTSHGRGLVWGGHPELWRAPPGAGSVGLGVYSSGV